MALCAGLHISWLYLKSLGERNCCPKRQAVSILQPAILKIKYENVKLAKVGTTDKHLDNVNSSKCLLRY